MVNCSYCNEPIKRLIFCKPSHKVMYHRHKKPATTIQLTKGKQMDTTKHILNKNNPNMCDTHNISAYACGAK